MADYIGATPQNPLLGLLYGGYDYLRSPQRTQQMQGLASLLESTGIPKTIERMSYGEPLTNIGRANVPMLKPETAEAMMTVAPMAGPAARGAGRLVGSQINRAMMGESVTGNVLSKAQKSLYSQEQALKLAQERASLPIEKGGLGLPANNTAMDRAGAMGFDTDVYHGTKADILIFDPTKPVFSAPNSEIANLYSQGANANIMPLMLRGKELSISDLNKSGVSGSFAENLAKRLGVYDKNDPFNLSDIRERELINQLPKYGIDRLKVTDMSDMGGIQTQYATPSGSSNIRSRFAAFDPFRKDVATATAMGVALPDLLANPVDQQRQQPSIQDLIDYGLLSP
jgi:hypothetical protein